MQADYQTAYYYEVKYIAVNEIYQVNEINPFQAGEVCIEKLPKLVPLGRVSMSDKAV